MADNDKPRRPVQADEIFVFGSNLSGIHGAGAAHFAVVHKGALYYTGIGRQGMSYAIPTKGYTLEKLPLDTIRDYVHQFLTYAEQNSEATFYVTAIGTGLAGFTHEEIAPMFKDAPPNCLLPEEWIEINGMTPTNLRSNRLPGN